MKSINNVTIYARKLLQILVAESSYINTKGHHGMGLHKRPTVGSGAVAAGTYADGNSWPKKPDVDSTVEKTSKFPSSLEKMSLLRHIDEEKGVSLFQDANGTQYIVRAASNAKSDLQNTIEDSIRAETVADDLYRSFLANDSSVSVVPSATIMHDGKLCKITQVIAPQKEVMSLSGGDEFSLQISEESPEGQQIRSIQKRLLVANSLFGDSSEDSDTQPSIVISNGKAYIVNNSNSKWTSENLLSEHKTLEMIKQKKQSIVDNNIKEQTIAIQINELQKTYPYLQKLETNPLISSYNGMLQGIAQYYTDPNGGYYYGDKTRKMLSDLGVSIDNIVANPHKKEHFDALRKLVDEPGLKTITQGYIDQINAKISNTNDIFAKQDLQKQVDKLQKHLDVINDPETKVKINEWESRMLPITEKILELKKEQEDVRSGIQRDRAELKRLTGNEPSISSKRSVIDQQTGLVSSDSYDVSKGLGHGIDELFAARKKGKLTESEPYSSMSDDDLFKLIKSTKNEAIASRDAMRKSIEKNVSDPDLRNAMLGKLDARIDSLTKLDTSITRMKADTAANYLPEYIWKFNETHQGLISDLIIDKYTLPSSKVVKSQRQIDTQITPDKKGEGINLANGGTYIGDRNGSGIVSAHSLPLTTGATNNAIEQYLLNTGQSEKTSYGSLTKGGNYVTSWASSQGGNSVSGWAGATRVGFMKEIMQVADDDSSIRWGKKTVDGVEVPMTFRDVALKLKKENKDMFEGLSTAEKEALKSEIAVKNNLVLKQQQKIDEVKAKAELAKQAAENAKMPKLSSDERKILDYDLFVAESTLNNHKINISASDNGITSIVAETRSKYGYESKYKYGALGYSVGNMEYAIDTMNKMIKERNDAPGIIETLEKKLATEKLTITKKREIQRQIDLAKTRIEWFDKTPDDLQKDAYGYSINESLYQGYSLHAATLRSINKVNDLNRESEKIVGVKAIDYDVMSSLLKEKANAVLGTMESSNIIKDLSKQVKSDDEKGADWIKHYNEIAGQHADEVKALTTELKPLKVDLAATRKKNLEDSKSLVLKTRLDSEFGRAMTAQHAYTYALLDSIDLPNHDKDAGIARIIRTDSDRRIERAFSLARQADPSISTTKSVAAGQLLGKEIDISRALGESFSGFRTVFVSNSDVSVSDIPFHRVLGTFWQQKYGSNGTSLFLGEGEEEYFVMPKGLPSTYSGSKYGSSANPEYYTNAVRIIQNDRKTIPSAPTFDDMVIVAPPITNIPNRMTGLSPDDYITINIST